MGVLNLHSAGDMLGGVGWWAVRHLGEIALYLGSADLDSAVSELLTPLQQRLWTVLWIGETATGEDVFVLSRLAT